MSDSPEDSLISGGSVTRIYVETLTFTFPNSFFTTVRTGGFDLTSVVSDPSTTSSSSPALYTILTTVTNSPGVYKASLNAFTDLSLASGQIVLQSGLHTSYTITTPPSTSSTPKQSPRVKTNATDKSTALTTGAKAGIGVGVFIAAVALIAVLIWLSRHYELTKKVTRHSETSDPEKHKQDSHDRGPAELGPDGEVLEAENTARPYEADSGNVRSELEGDERPRIEVAGEKAPENELV